MRNKLVLTVVSAGIVTAIAFWQSEQSEIEPVVIQDEQREVLVQAHSIDTAPDFASINDIQQKKTAFFDYLKPGIALENKRILKERARLEQIQAHFNNNELTSEDGSYAERLGQLYQVEVPSEGINAKWIDMMLHRVDVLPEALVLTQAAKESGWGTSRFATQANNYFGQWCYSSGCGVVPEQRKEGMTHEVASFSSVQESIHRYFMNVNRNRAYQDLRNIRFDLHSNNLDLLDTDSAIELANGLIRYSERGQPYVDEIQSMIRFNQPFWTK
ncbi:glucosaminidase domain-containing protein [Vibrio sp. ZSDE26]|uniref:Glucosaminidase domain-containing protein n=1 Tax=Vibrio amylolyticus TaxID=2847292 RepID=A0A9X2BMJ4_9VIBR|nr:glucosaminidase domain-containing protein [Vibrio amylolyticus]MCK6264998.1 glucosaminidase domain-containing protein [Vibrio amylolyticus]